MLLFPWIKKFWGSSLYTVLAQCYYILVDDHLKNGRVTCAELVLELELLTMSVVLKTYLKMIILISSSYILWMVWLICEFSIQFFFFGGGVPVNLDLWTVLITQHGESKHEILTLQAFLAFQLLIMTTAPCFM